uniref:Protein LURP-one-related 7 n=1 Tax=Davidia involucrata TaxID=16924 RepID=A0A5B7AXH3_DAVIN
MDTSSSPPEYQANFEIPVDLFVSKKHHGLTTAGGGLSFTDASGNFVFRVDDSRSDKSTLPRHKRTLLNASGTPLITIYRNQNGSWQGFRGHNSEEKDLIFRVERTLNTFRRTEFEVFLVGENWEDSKSDFKMKGCPFQRSCTIYKGNSIVAQTSLMYKLGIQKMFVPRCRFRLTIFPGFVDHALVMALIVIFFDGRKFWI